MLWSEQLLHHTIPDAGGKKTIVTTIAGNLAPAAAEGQQPTPPPASYAAQAEADVAIWTLEMEAGATWTMPPAASAATTRTLYFFGGESVTVGGRQFKAHCALTLVSNPHQILTESSPHPHLILPQKAAEPCEIVASGGAAEFLLLQGKPIGEPVVQHGPFVMNTKAEVGLAQPRLLHLRLRPGQQVEHVIEMIDSPARLADAQIMQAFADYQRTVTTHAIRRCL